MFDQITEDDRLSVLDCLAGGEKHLVGADRRGQRLAEVARLQPRAIAKLGPPPSGIWWVTDRALQQATAEPVARLKAGWFRRTTGPLTDVCCGIGGDLTRWPADRPALAIDRDPEMLAMAAANVDPAAAVRFEDVNVDQIPVDAWLSDGGVFHLDPDRRVGSTRRTGWDHLSPSPDAWAAIDGRSAGGVIKLAPATVPPDAWAERSHRVWISLGGSVREQSMLLGQVINHATETPLQPNRRSAITIRRGRTDWLVENEPISDDQIVAAPRVGGWIIDPDPAVRAAGLTATLAVRWDAQTIGGLTGFLTTDQLPEPLPNSSLAIARRVIEVVPTQTKRLRRRFREAGWFAETIKVRGGGEDPAALQRTLRLGDQPVGLWLSPAGRGRVAVVTEPIATPI